MSALAFPSSPSMGQIFEVNSEIIYEWTGYAWIKKSPEFRAIPVGGIIMWSGLESEIPKGWFLCDGSNGTPNLRNKFIIGSGSQHPVHTVGGVSSVSLSVANLPNHAHGASTSLTGTINGTTSGAGSHSHSVNDPSHTHIYPKYAVLTGKSGANPLWANDVESTTSAATTGITIDGVGDHTHTFSGTITTGSVTVAYEGGGQAFNTVPSYLALAYIMKG